MEAVFAVASLFVAVYSLVDLMESTYRYIKEKVWSNRSG